eukprot:2212947-Rhodomonas_salina.4
MHPTTLRTVTAVLIGEGTTMVTYKATVQQKGMKGSGPVHHKNVTEHETVNVVCQEAVVATFPNDQAPAGRCTPKFNEIFRIPGTLSGKAGVTCLRPGKLATSTISAMPGTDTVYGAIRLQSRCVMSGTDIAYGTDFA